MPRWPALALIPLLLIVGVAGETSAYFANWGEIGGRPHEPTCVDIPQNMPLCSGIDYSKMRLPNLLEHDTLKEAQQQSGYWVPLLNLRCHPNTQLFLCSLFTPVCLESPIYPCRSLCEAVRSGCESRMQTYSFPWPDMLSCEKFPLDNDMCITVQHTTAPDPERVQDGECPTCSPVETYENILDNYCRADLVIRARVKRQRRNNLLLKKSKRVYKSRGQEEDRRGLRRLRLSLTEEASCCSIQPSRDPYLIMGRRHGPSYIPTFVLPLKKSKPLRQAMKMFRHGLNCSDPNLITNNLEGTALSQEPPQRVRPTSDSRSPNGRNTNGRGSGGRTSSGRTSSGRTSSGRTSSNRSSGRRRRCFRKCRRNCAKKCRNLPGRTCLSNCVKTCRGTCRQRRGRGRGRGSQRNHRVTNGNRQPSRDVQPLSDITSEITNFAPADIERSQPEQGDN